MTLPTLPLIDGAFFVDNSFLEALQTCPRNAQHAYIDRRVIDSDRISLEFGRTMHSALEWRYKTLRNSIPDEDANSTMIGFFQKMYDEITINEGEPRDINLAEELIRRYNEKYRMEPFSILVDKDNNPMVEMSFAVPLFEYRAQYPLNEQKQGWHIPVYYCGRIDLPIDIDNQIYITDHKTDSMYFGAEAFLNEQKVSNQYRGYCWAFQQLTGREVSGFMVNGIRTKMAPAKPRTKTIDQWWDEGFVRDTTDFALYPTWADDWKHDAIELIEQFFWQYSRGEMPMLGKFTRACSRYKGCQFKDVCWAPTKEKGVEILQSNIFKVNDWTPLEKVKKV